MTISTYPFSIKTQSKTQQNKNNVLCEKNSPFLYDVIKSTVLITIQKPWKSEETVTVVNGKIVRKLPKKRKGSYDYDSEVSETILWNPWFIMKN